MVRDFVNGPDGIPEILFYKCINSFFQCVCEAFQISRQVKGHEGSVFCMCEMRSGTLLTGGGKDRKIILWDHELRADRDIEVSHTQTRTHTHRVFTQ